MGPNKILEQFLREFKADSYTDYPESASNNAKKALGWLEKYGREEVKAGTSVGWARAHQLASREAVSKDVIARMASFARHRKNAEVAPEFKATPWKDRGHVAWLLWGGTAGVDWAIRKRLSFEKARQALKEGTLLSHFSFLLQEQVNKLLD